MQDGSWCLGWDVGSQTTGRLESGRERLRNYGKNKPGRVKTDEALASTARAMNMLPLHSSQQKAQTFCLHHLHPAMVNPICQCQGCCPLVLGVDRALFGKGTSSSPRVTSDPLYSWTAWPQIVTFLQSLASIHSSFDSVDSLSSRARCCAGHWDRVVNKIANLQ
jgi:hypothetical protein